MKQLFRLLNIFALSLTACLAAPLSRGQVVNYGYVIGKAGNRARLAQIQRNEAIRRQQQQLQVQQQQKAQREQAAAAGNQNTPPVPNPPTQVTPFSAARPFYAYRQVMPSSTNVPAKAKTIARSIDSPRSQPVSEFSGPAYNDADPLLSYQREQADKGNPESQYAMALRYLDGNGVMQSDAIARDWLAKALANGNLKARAKLRTLNNPQHTEESTLTELSR